MNNTSKVRGVVIRVARSKENDCMLTLLCGEGGVISVCAKGIRSIRNPNMAACSLLCYSEFVLTKKGDFYTLSQASLIENFYALRESIEGVAYAAYFAALAAMTVRGAPDAADELRLLLNTMYMLEKRVEDAPLLRCVFELRLAALSGMEPQIECECGARSEYFNIESGCGECKAHKSALSRSVSQNVLYVMGYIQKSDLKDALSFKCDEKTASELGRLCEGFMQCHFGHLPREAEYIKRISLDKDGGK